MGSHLHAYRDRLVAKGRRHVKLILVLMRQLACREVAKMVSPSVHDNGLTVKGSTAGLFA